MRAGNLPGRAGLGSESRTCSPNPMRCSPYLTIHTPQMSGLTLGWERIMQGMRNAVSHFDSLLRPHRFRLGRSCPPPHYTQAGVISTSLPSISLWTTSSSLDCLPKNHPFLLPRSHMSLPLRCWPSIASDPHLTCVRSSLHLLGHRIGGFCGWNRWMDSYTHFLVYRWETWSLMSPTLRTLLKVPLHRGGEMERELWFWASGLGYFPPLRAPFLWTWILSLASPGGNPKGALMGPEGPHWGRISMSLHLYHENSQHHGLCESSFHNGFQWPSPYASPVAEWVTGRDRWVRTAFPSWKIPCTHPSLVC